MLSPQSKYALRALMFLNECSSDEFIQVQHIAKKTNLPGAYLSKIIKQLVTDEILIARRGKNGGIKINPEKFDVKFIDVCHSMRDPMVVDECVLLKKPCNKKSPCMYHGEWSSTKQKFLEFLKDSSIASSTA